MTVTLRTGEACDRHSGLTLDGFLPIFFLMVILKIPVAALLYLVWWAYKASILPEDAAGPPESEENPFRRFRREPKRPRGPRRGGHGPDAMPIGNCPPGGRARPGMPARAVAGHSGQRDSAETVRDG